MSSDSRLRVKSRTPGSVKRSGDERGEADARRLASVIGPALIAITVSELAHLDFIEKQYEGNSYLNGTFVFVAGLLIVRAHDRWTRGWPVAVTLSGWVAMLWGLFRMFAPQAQQGGASAATFIGIGIPLAAGIFLTYKGYRPLPNR